MGLDSLDEFSPKDTDPVSLGASEIRLTRADTKESVGLEHGLDGVHKIPSGTTANRPAAGRAGRVYFNTDSNSMEYDNGTAWVGVTNRKAAATVLWHPSIVDVNSGASGQEFPFDTILDDPGGYANQAYHQIIAPPNSIGLVTVSINWTLNGGFANGNYGFITTIQQYDGSNWQDLCTWWVVHESLYMDKSTIVNSKYGQNLRVVMTNGSGVTVSSEPYPLQAGLRPIFAYALYGTI